MRLRAYVLVVLLSVLAACTRESPPESAPAVDTTSSSASPSDSTVPFEAHTLVAQLPAGVEGLELAENGLRVKKGYEYVQVTDSTFAIARTTAPRPPNPSASGGCACRLGVLCKAVLRDGIIVCEGMFSCIECGLRVSGASGEPIVIFRYERPGQEQGQ